MPWRWRARRGAARAGGRFVLGYTTVFDRSAIPDVAGAFQRRLPDWTLVTKGKHSISLVRDLRNGAMDAAFVGLHTEAPGLALETLHEQPLVAALPAAHRLARKRGLGFGDLQGEPLFWFERRLNPGYYDYCAAIFARRGFAPTTLPEPPDHHIMLGMIAEGHGMALIPASLQQVQRRGVVFRPLKEALTAGIALAWSTDNTSAALTPFLALVRAHRW